MITTKTVKIKRNKFNSEYIEAELKKQGLDFLRWAITDCDDENFLLDVAVVEN